MYTGAHASGSESQSPSSECLRNLDDDSYSIILCAEDFIPIISSAEWSSLDIIAACHHENGNLIPSLCLLKKLEAPQATKAISVNQVHQFVTTGTIASSSDARRLLKKPVPKDKESLIGKARRTGFKVFCYPNHAVVILIRGERYPNQKTIAAAAASLGRIRHRSLNIINAEMRSLSDEWSQLQEDLDKLPLPITESKVIETFIQFFKIKYDFELSIIEHDPYENKWKTEHLDGWSSTIFRDIYCDTEGFSSGVPILGKRQQTYYLFAPVASLRRRIYIKHVLFHRSTQPVSRLIVRRLSAYLDYYYTSFLEHLRQKHNERLGKTSVELYEMALRKPMEIVATQQTATFAIEALKLVVSSTNAFSATLRFYDPSRRVLERLVEVTNGDVRKRLLDDETRFIPITASESVNASTFRTTKRGEYQYIEDLGVRSKKESDERQKYRYRINSRSEICFPICYKITAIGTMNFEAPMAGAFNRADIDFLLSIVRAIESHFAVLLEINDKYWLSQRAQLDQNRHELKNEILKLKLPETKRTEILRLIETPTRDMDNAETVALSKIVGYRDDFIRQFMPTVAGLEEISAENIKRLRVGCAIDLKDLEIQMSALRMSLMLIVYHNLLLNHGQHGDYNKDSLTVDHSGRFEDPVHFYLKSCSRALDAVTARRASLAPMISSKHGLGEGRGMLLVGVIARHLGGFVFVANHPERQQFTVEVNIPISERGS